MRTALRSAGAAGALLVWCTMGTTGAAAQGGNARPPAPPPPAVVEPPPTAYEPDLLKLADVLGSLAFLRELCGASEAPEWRARMTDLIEAEGTSPGRRERMAGAYNRGYRGFALTYRTCTAAALEAVDRLSADGERLSRRLAGRFGG
jgi:uncharacterized protein (TIGR02301 family)